MDFSNWKPHASSLGLIMTDPKGKTNEEKYSEAFAERVIVKGKIADMSAAGKQHLKSYDTLASKYDKLVALCNELEKIKDQVELSETCKSHLVECYVKAKYGRNKDVETDAMIKGTKMEEEGITVLSRNHKKMYLKNTEFLENEWVCGTPDIRTNEGEAGVIIDTKLSWDQFTFEKNRISEMDPKYYWQLQGYTWLDDAEAGKIAYVLVNTPEFLIDKAIKRMQFNVPESEWFDTEVQIRKNMIFDDVHIRERLIEQECNRSEADIERAKGRIVDCRKFLQQLDTIATWNVLSTDLK